MVIKYLGLNKWGKTCRYENNAKLMLGDDTHTERHFNVHESK